MKGVPIYKESYFVQVPSQFANRRDLDAIVDILEMNLFYMGVCADIVQPANIPKAGESEYDFVEYNINVKSYSVMKASDFDAFFNDAWFTTRDDFMEMRAVHEKGYISSRVNNLDRKGP